MIQYLLTSHKPIRICLFCELANNKQQINLIDLQNNNFDQYCYYLCQVIIIRLSLQNIAGCTKNPLRLSLYFIFKVTLILGLNYSIYFEMKND